MVNGETLRFFLPTPTRSLPLPVLLPSQPMVFCAFCAKPSVEMGEGRPLIEIGKERLSYRICAVQDSETSLQA
jgi:hypothetical protein